jgi:hypothetical protein
VKIIAVVLSLAVAGMAIPVPQALANVMNGKYGRSDGDAQIERSRPLRRATAKTSALHGRLKSSFAEAVPVGGLLPTPTTRSSTTPFRAPRD